jgi:hypothetical protein
MDFIVILVKIEELEEDAVDGQRLRLFYSGPPDWFV